MRLLGVRHRGQQGRPGLGYGGQHRAAQHGFKAAGITSPPTNWAQLAADAKKLMAKYPGTYGLGAPTYDSPAVASFIWGAGGQIATQQNGKWVAQLTAPQSEAGIKFYVDLYLTNHVSPAKYIGQTELGNMGATSGGPNEDFALGKLDITSTGRGPASAGRTRRCRPTPC